MRFGKNNLFVSCSWRVGIEERVQERAKKEKLGCDVHGNEIGPDNFVENTGDKGGLS